MGRRDESLTIAMHDAQAQAIVDVTDATPDAEHYLDLDGTTDGHGLLIVVHRDDTVPTTLRRITITRGGDLLTSQGQEITLPEIITWYENTH